jgi:hypothetical protein
MVVCFYSRHNTQKRRGSVLPPRLLNTYYYEETEAAIFVQAAFAV